MSTTDNPLLNITGLPPFSRIQPQHVEPAVDALLADNRQAVRDLLAANTTYTWDNLVAPLEQLDERLDRSWSPVSHMNAVVNSEALREAYNACLPKLSDYATEMGQNTALYAAFRQIADGAEYARLGAAQRKVIDNALRDFQLDGVALDDRDKTRFKAIMQELSTLTARFQDNLLDATNAWSTLLPDAALLDGLPESARAMLQQNAAQRQLDGWLLTLDFPVYHAVSTFADNRALREAIYTAYVTRASDEGPHAGQWDNSPLMEAILALRHEAAQLLGFDNYAERSLATKMAESPEHVLAFLRDLAERSLTMARRELDDIRALAAADGVASLEAWDTAYYGEKLRQQRYDFSQEELKPYFPEARALNGMFQVVERLYGLGITERRGIDTWHPDVRFFDIHDHDGRLRGQFYLDLYARPHKRGGAWMADCIGRSQGPAGAQIPVAFLTCNLSPPVGEDPALFTHDEVVTLFHEFGHGLHHMLTLVDYPSISGISGVAWDAVELPSQFMENWCWEREALDLIAAHYKTGEALPQPLLEKMQAARNHLAGMQMVRQLEFALFDFRLHMEYSPDTGARIYELLDEVRREVAVIQPPSFNRFPHSFSHIFAGGYAAGYYSYKWAEVLSADAFASFEERGIFDRETGQRFMQAILEQGGSREPMELFIEFRGREPTIDALLRHNGIAA